MKQETARGSSTEGWRDWNGIHHFQLPGKIGITGEKGAVYERGGAGTSGSELTAATYAYL